MSRLLTIKSFGAIAILFLSCFGFSQSPNADSLLRVTSNYKSLTQIADSNAIKSLNHLSSIFRKKDKTDTALLLAERALNMCSDLVESKNKLASSFAQREMASAHINLGNIKDNQAVFAEALDHFLKALQIRVQLKDDYGQAVALNNAGLIFLKIPNYKEALVYFNQAAKINKKIGNLLYLSRNLNNIGNTWFDQKNFEKALGYYEQSLAIKLKIDDKKGIALSYNNIGFIKEISGDLIAADSLYLKSIKIQRDQKNNSGIAMGLLNVATMRFKQKKYKEEEVFINEAYEICKKINDKEALMSIYSVKASLDSVKGDFSSAFDNIKNHFALKEVIKNEASGKKILQIQLQDAFERKQLSAKAEQEKKDAINAQKLFEEQARRNYFAVGLFLMTLLLVFVYKNYRDKKRINKELESKNEIIEEKQKEILDSIHYAKRIQKALLPTENYIAKAVAKLKNESNKD